MRRRFAGSVHVACVGTLVLLAVVSPDTRAWREIALRHGSTTISTSTELLDLGRRVDVDVVELMRRAIDRADGAISARPQRLFVYVTHGDDFPHGMTNPVSGWVYIFLEAARSTAMTRETLLVQMPWTIAHEYFHSKRRSIDGPYPLSLLATLVAEGGAETFAGSLYPAASFAENDRSLTMAQERRIWRRWEPKLHRPAEEDEVGCFWSSSSTTDRKVVCPHYTIGSKIITAYLAGHPALRPADVARVPAREVYADSGYDPAEP